MPPDDDDGIPEILDPTAPAEGTPAAPPPAPAATVSTASVLDSPEYKELLKANRKLARDAGSARAAEAAARATAEQTRQAAEAQQLEAQQQQIVDILGTEGLAEWEAIAELSTTDQVEAARRLAGLMQRSQTQSPAPGTPPAAPSATPPAEGTPPVAPPTGVPARVDADAPLTPPPGNEIEQLMTELNDRFAETAKNVQNPVTRGRTTMKQRAAALIGYLGSEYLKQGARPKS